jgi:hypothetical protein
MEAPEDPILVMKKAVGISFSRPIFHLDLPALREQRLIADFIALSDVAPAVEIRFTVKQKRIQREREGTSQERG